MNYTGGRFEQGQATYLVSLTRLTFTGSFNKTMSKMTNWKSWHKSNEIQHSSFQTRKSDSPIKVLIT